MEVKIIPNFRGEMIIPINYIEKIKCFTKKKIKAEKYSTKNLLKSFFFLSFK